MTVPDGTDRTEQADLIGWLRAQLDDDERGALACTERHWRPDGAKSCQVYVVPSDLSTRTIAWCSNGYDDDFANSLHIARHDPAHVLAEVAAKRRILDMCPIEVAEAERHPSYQDGRDPDEIMRDEAVQEEMEAVVRLLALPFADRPGYDERWRP